MISSLVSWEKLVKCLLLLFKSIDSTVTQSYLQALHMVVALPGLALSNNGIQTTEKNSTLFVDPPCSPNQGHSNSNTNTREVNQRMECGTVPA